jgi:protein SCO1/2
MSTRTPSRLRFPRSGARVIGALGVAALAAAAHAERPLLADQLPPEMEGVGIVEHLDEMIPLDLEFVDESGTKITLGQYFQPDRPVILTLNYYRCPMLCSLTLNGMVDGLKELDWSAGEEFEIITVSISPDEGPELADVKKRAYLTQYPRDTAAQGWHFLTGTKESIEALALATGFGYRKDERTDDYAHTSSIMFLTPDGRLSRYMNDVRFAPKDLRLALVEASKGAIGSPMDKLLLFMCYHFDPEAGSYAYSAVKLMRFGGLLTIIAIGTGLVVLWRTGPRLKQQARHEGERVTLGGIH